MKKTLFEVASSGFNRHYVEAVDYNDAERQVEEWLITNSKESVILPNGDLNRRYKAPAITGIKKLGILIK